MTQLPLQLYCRAEFERPLENNLSALTSGVRRGRSRWIIPASKRKKWSSPAASRSIVFPGGRAPRPLRFHRGNFRGVSRALDHRRPKKRGRQVCSAPNACPRLLSVRAPHSAAPKVRAERSGTECAICLVLPSPTARSEPRLLIADRRVVLIELVRDSTVSAVLASRPRLLAASPPFSRARPVICLLLSRDFLAGTTFRRRYSPALRKSRFSNGAVTLISLVIVLQIRERPGVPRMVVRINGASLRYRVIS